MIIVIIVKFHLCLFAAALLKIGKEHWMQPLGPLVQDSEVRIKDFLDTLLDIDEMESKSFANHTL